MTMLKEEKQAVISDRIWAIAIAVLHAKDCVDNYNVTLTAEDTNRIRKQIRDLNKMLPASDCFYLGETRLVNAEHKRLTK
jgi:hypothetical protein